MADAFNAAGIPTTYRGALWTKIIDALVGSGVVQGDILYRNATIWTRLGPGTAGQVLKTGGAAANPSWTNAGGISGNGMSYITGTTLGGAATSLSVGSLDIDTDECYFGWFEIKGAGAGNFTCVMQLNADTTTTNYDTQLLGANNTAVGGSRGNNNNINTIGTTDPFGGFFFIRRNLDSKASSYWYYTTLTTAYIGLNNIRWRTSSNVTSIAITSSVANAIATGSYMHIWRVHT